MERKEEICFADKREGRVSFERISFEEKQREREEEMYFANEREGRVSIGRVYSKKK